MRWGSQGKPLRDDGLNRGGEGETSARAWAGALQGAQGSSAGCTDSRPGARLESLREGRDGRETTFMCCLVNHSEDLGFY